VTRNAVLGVPTITATNVVYRITGKPLDRRNLIDPQVLRLGECAAHRGSDAAGRGEFADADAWRRARTR
jgi:hypothetical protein